MTPDSLFSLQGRVALVTGGSTGIGKMACYGLAAAGACVLTASRKAEACHAAADEINAQGLAGSVEGFGADISTEEGIAALISEVKHRTDCLHILMNNAGRTWGSPLGDFPYDGWGKVMDLNVTGMFHLTQGLIEMLHASSSADDPARVVNVERDGRNSNGRRGLFLCHVKISCASYDPYPCKRTRRAAHHGECASPWSLSIWHDQICNWGSRQQRSRWSAGSSWSCRPRSRHRSLFTISLRIWRVLYNREHYSCLRRD